MNCEFGWLPYYWSLFALACTLGVALIAERRHRSADEKMKDAITIRLRATLTHEAEQRMRADAAIGRVVWRFIDRMNDVCEQDPAERIVAEFVAAVEPAIDAALRPMQEWVEAGMPKREAMR